PHAQQGLHEKTVQCDERVGGLHARSVFLHAKVFLGLRTHRLCGPAWIPDQVDLDIVHAFHLFQALLHAALDHVRRGAARRCHCHDDDRQAIDQFDFIDQAQIDDVVAQFRVEHVLERFAHFRAGGPAHDALPQRIRTRYSLAPVFSQWAPCPRVCNSGYSSSGSRSYKPSSTSPGAMLSSASSVMTMGSGGIMPRLSSVWLGAGQALASSCPGWAAAAGWGAAAPSDVKMTSQSPWPNSFSQWAYPFFCITANSGTGLKVASRRRPWPALSWATAFMISGKGSPPARRIGRTSSVCMDSVMSFSLCEAGGNGGQRGRRGSRRLRLARWRRYAGWPHQAGLGVRVWVARAPEFDRNQNGRDQLQGGGYLPRKRLTASQGGTGQHRCREIKSEAGLGAALVHQILNPRHRALAQSFAEHFQPGEERNDLVQLAQAQSGQ